MSDQTPTVVEITRKDAWVDQHLLQGAPPFSFTYAGRNSTDLIPTWQRESAMTQLDAQRTQHTLTWLDPQTGLQVRCVAVTYAGYPAVEWTLYLINTGQSDTPILSDICALDTAMQRKPEKPVDIRFDTTGETEFILRHHTGDLCREYSFMPHRTRLEPGTCHAFAPIGGRPTNGTLPYFSLQTGDAGMCLAIGWPGQWAAQFVRDGDLGLRITAGQETTHFLLHPGEEARTPLIALLFWNGEGADAAVRGQNVWRRWMVAHNLPRTNGEPPPPFTSACMGLKQNEAGEKAYIDRHAAEHTGLMAWWMDAGWYPQSEDGHVWGWSAVGTWEADEARFPHGIRAVSDHARANGMKFILWFEPERVSPGTALAEHTDWLLRLRPGDEVFREEQNMRAQIWVDHEAQRNQIRANDALLDLGNPAACRYLTDFISRKVDEFGLDVYRQDFNIGPLKFWQAADAPDRQGLTENRWIVGLLSFWDELRRRHPNLMIDTCASGGRRIDLETLRRAVPLLRSDYQFEPIGNQAHTYGIASWTPYYGAGVGVSDTYIVRSSLCPALGLGPEKDDWELYRAMTEEWGRVADCYYGDFYPLTRCTVESDDWIAWQFDRPELGKGMLQVFRRPDSPHASATFKLHGLDRGDLYWVTNLDSPNVSDGAGGVDLMETGLLVELDAAPKAVTIVYECMNMKEQLAEMDISLAEGAGHPQIVKIVNDEALDSRLRGNDE
jgi:alpha-galactosidase